MMPKSADIEVEGKVFIGNRMRLVQRLERQPGQHRFFEGGRPLGMASVDYVAPETTPGELRTQRLTYALEPVPGEWCIENKGLCTSFGVFGAPGCGKTTLLKQMLYQIFTHERDHADRKFGALVLDPKAALVEDAAAMAEAAGRQSDLVIINTDRLLAAGDAINVIDVEMDPYELGKQLVMAARAAGAGMTSDPYWTLAWSGVFGAALCLLDLEDTKPTINALLHAILHSEDTGDGERRIIQDMAERVGEKDTLATIPEDKRRDALAAADEILAFFRQENENKSTIEAVIRDAYSAFLRSRYQCYSLRIDKSRARTRPNFYDDIIESGRIVMVSLSPGEPVFAKTLCTLVKCLFQRTVMARLDRVRADTLHNYERPLLLAADEYSQVATELQGESVGDGDFFSRARQFGCMGILCTQSVNLLQSSSLKENWRAVVSMMGGNIFMRLADNETAELATKLAGEADWYLTSESVSQSKEGVSTTRQTELRERKVLPSNVLTQVFKKGDAVVLGALDGSAAIDGRFLHVPRDLPEAYRAPQRQGGDDART